MNHKSYECHLQTAQRYEKEGWLIDVSDGGESKEDGQKVVSSNTEVRNCSSRVKRIEAGTIWPRREEDEGGEGDKDKEEEDEEVVEGKGWGGGGCSGVAAKARLKP